jgi:hypothetical protein
MKTVHPKSDQKHPSKSPESARSDERCAPAACVLDGVKARDLMVIHFEAEHRPSAHAQYLEAHGSPILEVRLVPTGQRLSTLANALRAIADQLDTLYADFAHKRQVCVDAIRATIERLTDLSESEQQQVWVALRSASREYYDDDIPF